MPAFPAGRNLGVAAKLHHCCCVPGAQIDTHVHMHMVHTWEHLSCSQLWVSVKKGEKHHPNHNHNKPVVLEKPAQPLVFIIPNTRTNVSALCWHIMRIRSEISDWQFIWCISEWPDPYTHPFSIPKGCFLAHLYSIIYTNKIIEELELL